MYGPAQETVYSLRIETDPVGDDDDATPDDDGTVADDDDTAGPGGWSDCAEVGRSQAPGALIVLSVLALAWRWRSLRRADVSSARA